MKAIFLAQAEIRKEDVEIMIRRQIDMLKAKGKKIDMPSMYLGRSELRSYEFFGKYTDIMHNALKEDGKIADLLTGEDFKKSLFLVKAYMKKSDFKKIVAAQLERMGSKGEIICPEACDTLTFHQFVQAFAANCNCATTTGELMKVLFQIHAKISKAKYTEAVGHQLEMNGLEADDVNANGLDDPTDFRHFLTAYQVDLGKAMEAQGVELDDKKQKDFAALVFSAGASMDSAEFKKIMDNQARMLKKPQPDLYFVPVTMNGPQFHTMYKKAMRILQS